MTWKVQGLGHPNETAFVGFQTDKVLWMFHSAAAVRSDNWMQSILRVDFAALQPV